MIEQIFSGQGNDRVEKILAVTERIERIDRAIGCIKYDNELILVIPEVLKTLGAAKEASIAELKTLN